MAETLIEEGKKELMGLAEEGIGKLQDKIDEKMAAWSTEIDDTTEFKSKIAKDPKLEDLTFVDLEKGGTINFQIGPVPAFLRFGFTFEAGLRYGVDYNAGWFRGMSVGASAGPYVIVGAFMEAGIGFDYTWISFMIAVGGKIEVFDFYAPLKIQALLKPELDMSGVGVKFYLTTSLSPELRLLAGKIYVKASGHVGIKPLAISFDLRRTIFEWKPLVHKKFGNIIPLKPLKLDLFSIGEGVKLMGKEL